MNLFSTPAFRAQTRLIGANLHVEPETKEMIKGVGKALGRTTLVCLRAGVILGVTGAALGGVLFFEYQERAAKFDLSAVRIIPQRSAVYDAHGTVYSYIQGENRFLIPLKRVPEHFISALLAREDVRFWTHKGLDYSGIVRAAKANLEGGGVRQGASTITQQLARNSFGLTERTIDRKIVEAMLAWRIEESFEKSKILEYYINRIYFGSGVYGLQRAAQVYFGKSADYLTLSECAMLVGIIRSPNRYSPLTNLEGAKEQRDAVLSRMVLLGILTPGEEEAAKSEPLRITGERFLPSQDSYVMDAVRRDLERLLSQEQITAGGLKIYTTIDPLLQKAAEKAVVRRTAEIEAQSGWPHPRKGGYVAAPPGKDENPTHYLQAALIAIDNRSGAIRALVGGRDYSQSKYDRACLSKRQVGSTFKPFVYATAFEHGLLPGSYIGDWRIEPGEFPDIPKKWSPDNSDGQYGGWLPAAVGLIRSRNTMSVRVGEFAGLDTVRKTVERLGLRQVPPYPSSFLGAFETTLRDLTSAYTAFPNGGQWSPSFLIARIETAGGKIIFDAGSTLMRARTRGLGSNAAELTSELLEQVLKYGTAARASKLGLKRIAAGKTGTTNECRDAWFVGYTQSLTCGVWVGFDKPKQIMHRGYGSVLALPIWVDFMEAAPLSSYPANAFPTTSQRLRVQLCAETGLRATLGCQSAGCSYTADLPSGMIPRVRCSQHDAYVPVFPAEPVAGPRMEEPPPAVWSNPGSLNRREEDRPPGRRFVEGATIEPGDSRDYTRDGRLNRRRSTLEPLAGGRRVIVIPAPGFPVYEQEERRPRYRRTPF